VRVPDRAGLPGRPFLAARPVVAALPGGARGDRRVIMLSPHSPFRRVARSAYAAVWSGCSVIVAWSDLCSGPDPKTACSPEDDQATPCTSGPGAHKLAGRRWDGYGSPMNLKLTAELHQDGEWYVGFCHEVPEANGQGRTPEECLQSLREAVLLLLEDRREDAARKLTRGVQVLELV
jgi:predicted RNase H-like HicB family nuclease